MSNYLVTGGCGFIGAHLAAALLEDGQGVTVLDDLSTGKRDKLPEGAELVIGDARDRELVRRLMAETDGCFHLAAIASVERCSNDWPGSHSVNQGATVNLLDAATRSATPIVYASSAAVYGNAKDQVSENSAICPISAYGVDKYGCELQSRMAGRTFGLPTVGLRLFNVFGPGQDPNSPYSGVISIFANKLLNGHPVEIFGDGTQTRDFIHVYDVVQAFLKAMQTADSRGKVYNICTGNAVTIETLAKTMRSIVGSESTIQYLPSRSGDIHKSVGTPEAAAEELAFNPRVSLERGLALTLEALRN